MSVAAPTIEVHLPDDGPLAYLASDVRVGLSRPFKELPPKYFYDERGSRLFEQITELPEYYPTRAERAILESYGAEIVAASAECNSLIELGSGAARKTKVLLDALRDSERLATYVPVDISEEITREASARLLDEYPGVEVHGVVCDYELHLSASPVKRAA